MRGTPTTFWGKLRATEDNQVLEWHPLTDHCADVAAVAKELMILPLWRARLARLAGHEFDEITLARLACLAALHDIGKFNLGFQAKGRPELGTRGGHVAEAVAAIGRCLSPLLAPLGDWGDAGTSLLSTSICHHGRPVASDAGTYNLSPWQPRAGLDPRSGIEDMLGRCRVWFPQAFETGARDLPESPEFSHAFAGLVMLADWIGSDTSFFPYSEDLDVDRMVFARRQACSILEQMTLAIPAEARTDPARRNAFDRIDPSGFAPRPIQRVVLDLDGRDGGVTVIESDTGSGKTEAALAHFIPLFERGEVDGLYFALPTRTAATQIHRRVVEAARHAFADPPPVLLAVPGYLRVDDSTGRKLAGFEVQWPDQDRFRFRGWAAENSKRFLAGSIVVGTIDQVLLSSLRVNHAHLRATTLLRMLLVVDEVHASDAYMIRILEDVLARHRKAGGQALLLSATLGGEARRRLTHPGARTDPPTLREAIDARYPLITTSNRTLAIPSPDSSREIETSLLPLLEDHQSIAERALTAARAGLKVLVIKNTVRDCVRTQLEIESLGGDSELFRCMGKHAPHHSRFSRPDREALDRAIEDVFGKERSRGGCVAIATQTVQQSLDLDADLLITDLCPADVLLQRMGRLHRHQRRDRPGDGKPRAMVVVPRDRDLGRLIGKGGRPRNHHGLGSVYEDLRMLEATWRILECAPVWRIPEMNREIVESSVHSEALAAISRDCGAHWEEHETDVIGRTLGSARHAELGLVDWRTPYDDTLFPAEPSERIRTRLGEGDRRVKFDPSTTGAFYTRLSELSIRASWTSGVPAEEEAASGVTLEEGVVTFSFGRKSFTYDRLGLRPTPSRVEEEGDGDDDGP